jgi:hypothetical protein
LVLRSQKGDEYKKTEVYDFGVLFRAFQRTVSDVEMKKGAIMNALRRKLPQRFWLEAVFGLISTVLLVLTVVMPNWIELVFTFTPDAGNGSTEWGLTFSLAAVSILMFAFAGRTWKQHVRLLRSI